MKNLALAMAFLSILLSFPSLSSGQAPPAGFSYQTLVDGPISLGCSMSFAPDGRLFIAERVTGNIRVYANGVLGGTWATIPKTGTSGSEQGLLGIAVDPNFLTNRYVYVYYTRTAGIVENVVARLEEVGGVGTNLTVISPVGGISSVSIHNGGRLVFGQDGKLYVGTGDRSSSATAQNKGVLHGKILRMNVPDGSAPADNPFATDAAFHPLVWSYGHRNQYGLTVNPLTGDVFQTENGQNVTDEVNRIVKAGNYGWPTYEGGEPVADPATVDPLATYSPTPDPTGTCFYTGNNYPPAYQNAWFYIKYTANQLQQATLNGPQTAIASQVQFDDLPGNGFDIQSGPDGNLWYLTNDTAGLRGGDELGRYLHASAPNPALNVTALCNQILGGSATLGFTGTNGDSVLSWFSLTKFATPISSPYGDLWVPLDFTLPLLPISADNRLYLGLSVPGDMALNGIVVHFQDAHIPVAGPIKLSNPAQITLK